MSGFRRVVVAFGGNALSPRGNEPESIQAQQARRAIDAIMTVLDTETRLALVHGNGPQVGAELLRDRTFEGPLVPLSLAGRVASTQGSIGALLELELRNHLAARRIRRPVATLVTFVEVDPGDSALNRATKPVGPFYSAAAAKKLEGDRGWRMVEDAGRGWRRVVVSPVPQRLLNAELIGDLVAAGVLVVVGGGGGVGVACIRPRDGGSQEIGWRTCDAVIDKDRTATLVAQAMQADLLINLTMTDHVYLDYGTKRQRPLHRITATEARRYSSDGQFGPGSLAPKVEAAVEYVENTEGKVLITVINEIAAALEGHSGTMISQG